MADTVFAQKTIETGRHRTAWIEAGPADGPLMVLIHGWPELSLVWRAQIEHFAAKGWRCVAPDMRGYGGSSVPSSTGAYAIREVVADMVELHEALGSKPAIWVGHDWGSPVAWGMASHHAERCRGVVNLCVPYLARGFTLSNLVALVDRGLYPIDRYPVGQWDFNTLVAAFRSTGFSGADAWYMNDAANLAYAAEAPRFGRLTLPTLFLHATRDVVCDTVHSRLAEPMREDCADLTEVTITGGHELTLECPDEVNEAITGWLSAKHLG